MVGSILDAGADCGGGWDTIGVLSPAEQLWGALLSNGNLAEGCLAHATQQMLMHGFNSAGLATA